MYWPPPANVSGAAVARLREGYAVLRRPSENDSWYLRILALGINDEIIDTGAYDLKDAKALSRRIVSEAGLTFYPYSWKGFHPENSMFEFPDEFWRGYWGDQE